MANNPLLQSPFDKLTEELEVQANAPLPGQQSVTQAPAMQEVPTAKVEAPPATTAAPATAETPAATTKPEGRRPSRSENYMPPADLRPLFDEAARKHNVPVNVLMALGHQESRFNAKAIGTPTQWGRAKGMLQYLDSTAAGMGINPFDAAQSVEAAAKQIRQRLDKGYSMEDAVKEHFAGPDRKKWGTKTAAYGREVMEKVHKIGGLLGAEPPSQTSAATGTDTPVPADWLRLTPEQAAAHEAKAAAKAADDLEFTTLGTKPAKPTTIGQDLSDVGKNLSIGLDVAGLNARELLGRIPVIGQPFIDATDAAARYLHPPTLQDQITGKKTIQTGADVMNRRIEATKKELTPQMSTALEKKWYDSETKSLGPAWSDWRSYAGGLTQSLPEQAITMIPAVRLAKMAHAAKLAAGATAEVASIAAARTAMISGGISEGMMGGAHSARDVRDAINELTPEVLGQSDAYKSLVQSGLNPAEAKKALAEDLATRAFITSGVVTGMFGGMGDRAIARIFTKQVGGNIVANAVKNSAKGAVAEGLFEELPQSMGQRLSQNEAVGQVDPTRALSDDVINQGLGGMAIGGVQGGAMGGLATRRSGQAAPVADPAAAGPSVDPATGGPAADPAAGPAPQPGPAPVPPTQAAPIPAEQAPAAPSTGKPLTSAVEGAAEQPQRVVVQTPDGQAAAGTLQAYQEDGQGGFTAQIVDDAGQVVTISDKDGVQVTPVAPAAGPLSAAVEDVAATEPSAAPVEPATPVAETAPAAPIEPAPAAPESTMAPAEQPRQQADTKQIADMTDAELRTRLKYIAGQAKATGWDKRMMEARREVEREINTRNTAAAAQAAETEKNAPIPTSYPTQAEANAGALKWAERTSTPHEVVETDGLYNVQPVKEAANGTGTDASVDMGQPRDVGGRSDGPAGGNQSAVGSGNDADGSIPGGRGDVAGNAPAGQQRPAESADAPGNAADAQPALDAEPDAHAGKWFGSTEKAEAYVAKKKIGATHEVVKTGKVRFEVKPRAAAPAAAPAPAAEAAPAPKADWQEKEAKKAAKLAEQLATANDNAAKRAAEKDEPPVANGMTRLYHGSADHGRYDGKAWFSTDRKYAQNYRPGAELQYVDVPTERINKLADPDDYGQVPAKGFTYNGEFDSSDVGVRKPLLPAKQKQESAPAAEKVPDLAPEAPTTQGATNAPADQPTTSAGVDAAPAAVPASDVPSESGQEAGPVSEAAPSTIFDGNKLFTADKVAAARARMKSKLSQLNSGLDPELMMDGMVIAGAYLEAGTRKFSAYAKAMTDDFGPKIKPFLLSFYEAARHYPGLDTDGMSTSDVAKKQHEAMMLEQDDAPAAEAAPAPAPAKPAGSLRTVFEQAIGANAMPKDNPALRKMVEGFDGKPADQTRMKQAQEIMEAAIAQAARDIVAKGKGDKSTFDALVRLYESQPNLNIRTSTSIANQAYSTPAPLAFLASQLAGIDGKSTVLEPTAGTGLLLIGAAPKNVVANELDAFRAGILREQGYTVTEQDASQQIPVEAPVDAVITNPPFGSIKGADGKVAKVKVDGFSLGQIDHLIAARALANLKDDGRATLIIGASKVAGGISNSDLIFFNWLYSHYNVTGHFEVEGDLYQRQGAGWPVRVISINGRATSGKVSPAAGTVPRANNWSEVYEQFTNSLDASRQPVGAATTASVRDSFVEADAGSVSQPAGTKAGQPGQPKPASGKAGAGNVAGTSAGTVGDRGGKPAEPVGADAGAQRVDAAPAVGNPVEPTGKPAKREAAKPDGDRRAAVGENQFQSAYVPRSARKDEGVLIPVNMAGPTQDALSKLEDEVGDIDAYAARELGYESVDELHDAFMGLQVDSVASAIHQIGKGKGIIIADQTGIGKGRQAAAVIRWAIKNGHVPVFVTVKPSLFTDMYGDLADIGSNNVAPFIMNSAESIKGANDEKLFANKPATHRRNIDRIASGQLPDGANAIFMTYSQINVPNAQRAAIMGIADRAVFILDESHNAGGESATGAFVQEVLALAKGVTYLSATYAKRPDNMPVYFKTDIGDAVADSATLMQAMENGGLPLQTVVSNNLVRAGQMFRRERSYDGVNIESRSDTARRAEHEKLSNETTLALRAIVAADKAFHEGFVQQMKDDAAKEGARVLDNAGNQAGESVNHTEFSSVVHNFVRQMLMGLKAQAAADEAIASIKRGEKPLIALENTMGSFLAEYADNNGLKAGDKLGAFDYRTVLSRALDRTRYVTRQLSNGDKVKEYVALKDLDATTREAYAQAQATIDALNLDIPVSPLDWMRQEITKAGHTVAEITGRNLAVDYSDPKNPVLSSIDPAEQKDKVATTRRFNDGRLDAIILNVAGSTGISLHSSERFLDQRQRHMIVAQPAQDINIFMQMLGRIHRTGQVNLPKYTILNVDLPAEKRPTALLSKKMKSLNANTSSNTESATSVKSADMLNKYGDQIVGQYLEDNKDLALALGIESPMSESGPLEDVARKATGRLALMPVDVQIGFYEEVEAQYNAHMDYLNKTNQNDLEPRTFDFDAKELKQAVLFEGQNPSTPFGEDAIYGEYSVKAQGKAMTPDEIRAGIEATLAGATPTAHLQALIDAGKPDYQALVAKMEPERAAGEEGVARGTMAFMRSHPIGSAFRVDINGDVYTAIVTNMRSTHKGRGNPFSLSKIQLTVALNGALRSLSVPATQFKRIEVTEIGRTPRIDDLFAVEPDNQREKAKIITGNLLAAYGELAGVKGTVISFTKEDGSQEQGILMPKIFDFTKNTVGDYRLRSGSDAMRFLMEGNDPNLARFGIATRDGVVRVTPSGSGIQIQVPKSKAKGGKYFLDENLRAIVGDFISSGNVMAVKVDQAKAVPAIEALMRKQALYAAASMAEGAKAMFAKPDEDTAQSVGGAGSLTPDTLKASITAGDLGPVVSNLINAGAVVIHPTAATLPKNLAGARVQAQTERDGTIHLVAENLTGKRALPVLLHEMFHAGAKSLMSDAAWKGLLNQLASIHMQAVRSTGRARQFYDAGARGVANAKAAGDKMGPAMTAEEFGAYTIEAYEQAPPAFQKWVDDVIGAVKAWTLTRFGKQLGDVTPAQLSALAKAAMRAAASPKGGNAMAPATASSVAPESDVRNSVAAAEAGAPAAPAGTVDETLPPGFTPPDQGLLRRVQASIQDNMNRVRQVQDTIEKIVGQKISQAVDYYGAETNRPGRIAARLEDGEKQLTKPLMERLAKSGHTAEQLGELLHAMHAQERNEHVAKFNQDMPDGGSGMTTAKANEILDKYELASELHDIARQARAIAQQTLEMKHAYGLIDDDTLEQLTDYYESYVPLKGDGEYGPKVKRAMGHEEREEHILENIARDFNQAVVVGEKNRARQVLLRMVLKFADPELWTVGVPPKGRRIAGQVYFVKVNGKAVASYNTMSQATAFAEAHGAGAQIVGSNGEAVMEFVRPLQDNEVMVYIKGAPIRIQIKDEALAAQLRPMNQEQMHLIGRIAQSVNRYFSKIYTGYNPAFILRNAARDAMTGTVNMMGNYGSVVAAKAWTRYPTALATLGAWAATGKVPDGQAGNYLTEYRQHGGKVGASHMADLDAQGQKLSTMFDDAKGAIAYAQEGRVGKAAWITSRKAVRGLAHVVEVANQATENALRLALFMELRARGETPGKAAQAAKTVTVDFDRKGSSTGVLSAAYLFFNPAVQGAANGIKTLAQGKHKEQAWAAVGSLVLAGAYLAAKGMDDDEDRWLGESWGIRSKNFIINTGSHQIRVPISQEFAPAFAFGMAMTEASRGQSKSKAAMHMVSAFLDAYFPFKGVYEPGSDAPAQDLATAFVPTLLQLPIQSAFNRNAFGSKIVPESEFTKDRPDNLKMGRMTKGTPFDSAAQGIASFGEMMGFARYENDITKVSPETLKLMWQTYTGGLGTFVTDSVGLAKLAADGESEITSSKIPFAKDFYRNQDVKPLRGRYYDLTRQARKAIAEFDSAKKAGDDAEMDKIDADAVKSNLVDLGKMVNKTIKAANQIRDEAVDIAADTKLSNPEKQQKLKEIEKEEELLYRDAIQAFK